MVRTDCSTLGSPGGLARRHLVANIPVAGHLRCPLAESLRDSPWRNDGAARLRRRARCAALGMDPHGTLLVVSPQTIVSVGTRLTSRYYSGVRAEFIVRDGIAHGRYTGCIGWDENMWAEIHGGLELMLELAGGKDVQVRLTAGGQSQNALAEFEGHRT